MIPNPPEADRPSPWRRPRIDQAPSAGSAITMVGSEVVGMTMTELAGALGGTGRARMAWQGILKGLAAETTPLGQKTRDLLTQLKKVDPPVIFERQVDVDKTTKLAIRLSDGAVIETVLIPSRHRTTVCVSCQVGCTHGCVFCVTTTMGLKRSLSAAEIIHQILLAKEAAAHSHLPPVRNVVFMGMGEPLDNFQEITRSILIMTHPWTLAIAPNHITVSTIGPSPQAILQTRDLNTKLAWSLPAVDDQLRLKLVPKTRHSMESLRAAFLEVMHIKRAVLFIETTLIHNVNDQPAHAQSLVDFLKPFMPNVRVNLLPCNPGRPNCQPSTEKNVATFRQIVTSAGMFCMLRKSRGTNVRAACGQLANKHMT